MTAEERVAASVSRETYRRLTIYVAELRRWQPAVNLVSNATLTDVWTRHVEDSLQLAELESGNGPWLDLGSGAGLPGLIVAAAAPARVVDMIESDSRKCAFLRNAARAMGVSAIVHEGRIERVIPTLSGAPTVVTARALASLDRLLDYAQALLLRGAVGLFPKGRSVATELTTARESWTFDADLIDSRTDSEARIVRITHFKGRRS